jgi:hypothetical protein
MRRIAQFLLAVLLLVPGFLHSEVLYLKDGSVLKGRVVSMDPDTLYFETSFGSKLAVHRGKVARIELEADSARSMQKPAVGLQLQTAAEAGTLSVSFEKFEVTSRIVVKRGDDREVLEKANAIEQVLAADGKKVHSVVDSLTDKAVRNGPATMLRNDAKPQAFDVALAPGFYRCVISFGNTRGSDHADRFDPAPLDRRLVIDPVRIDPGQRTEVRVGMKRKWTGKSELFKVE